MYPYLWRHIWVVWHGSSSYAASPECMDTHIHMYVSVGIWLKPFAPSIALDQDPELSTRVAHSVEHKTHTLHCVCGADLLWAIGTYILYSITG